MYQNAPDLMGLMPLDPYAGGGTRFVAVVDTDALLSSLDNHYRTGRPSLIARLARSYRVEVFAADHVYGELYSRFRKIVKDDQSAAELRTLFEERYLPYIRWVTIEPAEWLGDQRVQATFDIDETDVPTAQLASLIGPCLVLSGDKSLRRPGFAPEEWRPAVGGAVTMVSAEARSEGPVGTVGMPVFGVVAGTVKLGNRFGVPWFASVLILGLGVALILEDPTRRSRIWTKVGPFVEALADHMAEEQARARSGRSRVADAMCGPAEMLTAKQMLTIVLSRTTEPMLAQEIQTEMMYHFGERVVPNVAGVRELLRDCPEFIQPERYRWRLGRYSGPWRGDT